MSLYGIDVSSYQGQPDWVKVAASGQAFAWTKATEGTTYVNPDFAYNWQNIKANNMVRGAYHFARPDSNSAKSEVDFFLNTVGSLQPTDLIALDLENGTGDLSSWCLEWLTYCASKIGFNPWLYSGVWFLQPHGCLDQPAIGQFPLWLSGYVQNMPAVPADWHVLSMWQFTDKAIVPGISTPVDQSYFLGDINQLKALGTPSSLKTTVNDQLVTILSVIGDNTYPDGSSIDDLAKDQTVSKRIFIRELVQHGKALLGA